MRNRVFAGRAFAALLILALCGDAVAALPRLDALGRIGEMITNAVMRKDAALLASYFERRDATWEWRTEFWGKHMQAAAPVLSLTGDTGAFRANLQTGIDRLLATQLEDGYIGNYVSRCGEGWDVWGIKYTLLGLLEWHRATGDARALNAAKRLADFLIAETGPGGRRRLVTTGNYLGLASGSVLEPVVWLARETGERRYAEMAREIVRQIGWDVDGPQLVAKALDGVPVAQRTAWRASKMNGTKAYEMMSCYQGLADWWEFDGRRDSDVQKAIVRTAEDILANEINVIGSAAAMEHFFRGRLNQQRRFRWMNETCVTVTWMRLAEKLLEMTHESRWADALETSFLNAWLGSIVPDASRFDSYPPVNGSRGPFNRQCGTDTNCCNENGPRGFLAYLQGALVGSGDDIYLNFFLSGERGPASRRFRIESDWPNDGRVKVTYLGETAVFTLHRRIPLWVHPAGGYVSERREWKRGDERTFVLEMKPRAEFLNDAAAVLRGPVVYTSTDASDEPRERYEAFDPEKEIAKLVPFAAADGRPCRTWLPLVRDVWEYPSPY